MNLSPIAFVLPQFHPIPENDEWWGKGFTEWTNVSKAKPLFEGHYQPHLPTDTGFYDLRLEEARMLQSQLAKSHGIHGFCYYHYWFNGKRLLYTPLDEILRLNKPDFPFMLCWANENWTRTWDGSENEVLIAQNYSEEDDILHMKWLCEHVFSDSRYIKVDGCPVFVIYRHTLFPNIEKTASIWREIAQEHGFKDLYLCITDAFKDNTNPDVIGFDAVVEFSPHKINNTLVQKTKLRKYLERYKITKRNNLRLRDFKAGVQKVMDTERPEYKLYPSATPSWDNSARKGKRGIIALGSSPSLFKTWLSHIVNTFKPYSKEENFVFINAMNEWAEGNHLEPCIKYGTQYLEAVKDVFEEES